MNNERKDQVQHPYVPAGLLGVMVPYGNFAVEWELQILLGYPNFALTTRIMADEGKDMNQRLGSYFEPARLSAAMQSFGSTPISCVGIACSATSYFIGQEREAQVFGALEREFDARFTWSTKAIREGLESLGSRSMHLVSPYPIEVTQRCVDYWTSLGVEVEEVTQIGEHGPGFHPIYTFTPAAVEACLEKVVRRSQSPVVITGTGVSALPAIMGTLRARGASTPPILSANLCLARSMLEFVANVSLPAEDWFTSEAQWIKSAQHHPRMQEFINA